MNAFVFALLQATGHVAPEESGRSANLLSPNGGLMFWTLVTFVFLFVILWKFVFPPMFAAVEAREKALEDAIEGAKRDREAAAQALAEQQRQIEAARNEAQQIVAQGRQTGEQVRAQMERAIAEMRREAIDLAIAGASKVIEKNLDDQSNRKIVESFLSSIPAGEASR